VRILKIRKDPKCPVCSEHPTQTTLIDYEAFCGVGASSNGAAHEEAGAQPAASASAR